MKIEHYEVSTHVFVSIGDHSHKSVCKFRNSKIRFKIYAQLACSQDEKVN